MLSVRGDPTQWHQNSFVDVPMNIPKPNAGWVKHSKDGLQQVQVIFDHAEAIWLAKAPLMARPAFSDCKSVYWKLVNHLMVVYTNQNTWLNLLQPIPGALCWQRFTFGMFVRACTILSWHHCVGSPGLQAWVHLMYHPVVNAEPSGH